MMTSISVAGPINISITPQGVSITQNGQPLVNISGASGVQLAGQPPLQASANPTWTSPQSFLVGNGSPYATQNSGESSRLPGFSPPGNFQNAIPGLQLDRNAFNRDVASFQQPAWQPSSSPYMLNTGFGPTANPAGYSYADFGKPGTLSSSFPQRGIDPKFYFAPAAASRDLPALLGYAAGLGLPLNYGPDNPTRGLPPAFLGQSWTGSVGNPISNGLWQ
ncbi:MAG: hypothetical protein ACKO37_06055 [Vampirovibrionales bacterium]